MYQWTITFCLCLVGNWQGWSSSPGLEGLHGGLAAVKRRQEMFPPAASPPGGGSAGAPVRQSVCRAGPHQSAPLRTGWRVDLLTLPLLHKHTEPAKLSSV